MTPLFVTLGNRITRHVGGGGPYAGEGKQPRERTCGYELLTRFDECFDTPLTKNFGKADR